jgi:hypothetical protein
VTAFSQINDRRIYAFNQVMIDSVIMDTKELGAILQPNLHNEYQAIFSDVDIPNDLRKQLKFIEVNPLFD